MKTKLLSVFILTLAPKLLQAQGGSLIPPEGPPGPVMKTLQEVEARIPLVAGQPGVSIDGGSGTITISQPGSYYLTGNLNITTPGAAGVTVSSQQVTLDLNGYSLVCTLVNGGAAIQAFGNTGLVVTNGNIRGGSVYDGVSFTFAGWLHGVAAGNAGDVRVSDLTVRGVRQDGIQAGNGSVSDALVDTCGGTGITATTVKDSVVRNANGTGISINTSLGGGLVENCLANSAGTLSIAHGIHAPVSQVSNSRGSANAGTGITAGQVTNSLGTSNSGIGIVARCATNSFGETSSGSHGMDVEGTASFCRGDRFNGTAIRAGIAIGCTMAPFSLIIESPQKHLGTP